jgi:hypothetical protein
LRGDFQFGCSCRHPILEFGVEGPAACRPWHRAFGQQRRRFLRQCPG